MCRFISKFSILFHCTYVGFCTSAMPLWLLQIYNVFSSQVLWCLQLCSFCLCYFCLRLLWLFGVFCGLFSCFCKNATGILIGTALNLQITLNSMDMLIILILIIHKTWDVFHFVCFLFNFFHQPFVTFIVKTISFVKFIPTYFIL